MLRLLLNLEISSNDVPGLVSRQWGSCNCRRASVFCLGIGEATSRSTGIDNGAELYLTKAGKSR